jgi:hypothetical protein
MSLENNAGVALYEAARSVPIQMCCIARGSRKEGPLYEAAVWILQEEGRVMSPGINFHS